MSTSSDDVARTALAVGAARENLALIQLRARGRDMEDLRADTQVRYAIERAFMALDAAIRDIPKAIIDAHELPAAPIAGFRNALAHTYEDIMDERVILTIREDLP